MGAERTKYEIRQIMKSEVLQWKIINCLAENKKKTFPFTIQFYTAEFKMTAEPP